MPQTTKSRPTVLQKAQRARWRNVYRLNEMIGDVDIGEPSKKLIVLLQRARAEMRRMYDREGVPTADEADETGDDEVTTGDIIWVDK